MLACIEHNSYDQDVLRKRASGCFPFFLSFSHVGEMAELWNHDCFTSARHRIVRVLMILNLFIHDLIILV
jgi:hypothetical protein